MSSPRFLPVIHYFKADLLRFGVLWLCLLFAGCANSLNDTHRLIQSLESHPTHPIVAGAKGPLTRQQTAAVIAKLKAESDEDTPLLERDIALEQTLTGNPLTVGNKVTLLKDGPATYAASFNAIRNAKDSINLETFTFRDDEVGQAYARMLIERAQHGVAVNIIYDSFGSVSTPAAFFDNLRRNHIAVVEFNPLSPLSGRKSWAPDHRDHRKLLVVDGRIALSGGVNIDSVYSSGFSGSERTPNADVAWRDTDVEIEGPAVAQCQTLFIDTWFRQTGRLPASRDYFPTLKSRGSQLVRVIGSTPDAGISAIYATIFSAVQNAQKNIYLTDAYFAPPRDMHRALRDAGQRGVDVELVLPRQLDHWLVLWAQRAHYHGLLKANVEVYERLDAMLHAKTLTIDGIWSTVGSSNFDWWSFARNDEINVVVLGSGFAVQMEKMFQEDREQSVDVQLYWWERQFPITHLRVWSARAVEPML